MSAPIRAQLGMPGDYAAWSAVAEGWENAADTWFQRLSERLGAKALELATDAFAKQQDPYGTPWTPSQRVLGIRKRYGRTGSLPVGGRGTGLTLVDSGDLLLSLEDVPGGTWFAIRSPLPYANIQNYGWPLSAKHPPPGLPGKQGTDGSRAWLPSDGDWGDWREAFERESDDLFASYWS